MSGSTRRRSRGPNQMETSFDNEFTLQQKSRSPRTQKILTAATVTLVITVVILSWFQLFSTPSLQPFRITASSESSFGTNSYILHPASHINRETTTFKHKWRITKGLRRPDGVLKEVYLINDAFPGPTLEARSGDRLIVEVENGLRNEGVSLHWHGLSMRGANDMDGAVGITQNSIQPGSTFTYDFRVEENQHGTFWYHAHGGVQRGDGMFGGLVVHQPRETQAVDDERLLLIGDWYHRNATDALEFYMHPGSFGNEPVPDSILLNGQGAFDCADAVPARPLDCKQRSTPKLPALRLDGTKRTILRVVNVGSYAGFELSVDNARLTPLRVDGGYRVAGQAARRIGSLEPGERVDLEVDFIGSNRFRDPSFLKVTLDTSPFKYPNSALTPTHEFPLHWLSIDTRESTASKVGGTLEFGDVQRVKNRDDQSAILPMQPDQTVVLYTITQKLAHLSNEPHGFINNTSWKPQTMPRAPLIEVDRDLWDKNQFVPQIKYERDEPLWVDIVLNNLDEEGHPFHLHGYDFWVLSTYSSSYNWGSYNPFEDDEPPGGPYNTATPVKKDTVLVPRRGYAVLRLRADNPGIWMFHCHNLWHQASGMAMALEVGRNGQG